MRVLLSGGGSAGHINPALAIAENIRRNAPDAEIAFVGIKGGKEDDLVPREGYPLYYVDSMRIERRLTPANVKALWVALTSPYAKKTTKILEEFRPDVVIGTGGYACWPIMAAAARRGIPTALHESNALPGLTVRKLQGRVDRVWTNFERTAGYLNSATAGKILHVGNPLRGGFGTLSREDAKKKLGISPDTRLILSFGGSLGAENMSDAVLDAMESVSARHSDVIHLHVAGKRDYERLKTEFAKKGLDRAGNCLVVDYLYDMPLRMTAADLVISRAGAMSISELALCRRACVLIPSPYVAENHQYINAKVLADAGAAVLIEEKTLPDGTLSGALAELLAQPERLSGMEEQIRNFADPDANRRIWEDLQGLIR